MKDLLNILKKYNWELKKEGKYYHFGIWGNKIGGENVRASAPKSMIKAIYKILSKLNK